MPALGWIKCLMLPIEGKQLLHNFIYSLGWFFKHSRELLYVHLSFLQLCRSTYWTFWMIFFHCARHSTPSLVVALYLPLTFVGRLCPSPSLAQVFTGSFLWMQGSFNCCTTQVNKKAIFRHEFYSLQQSVLSSSANHNFPYYCPWEGATKPLRRRVLPAVIGILRAAANLALSTHQWKWINCTWV